MKKITSILLLTAVLHSCCDEPVQPTEVPAATNTGANQLACKINDEVYIHHQCFGIHGSFDVYGYYNSSDSTFGVWSANNQHFEFDVGIELELFDVFGIGTYPISHYYGQSSALQGYQGHHWDLDTLQSHQVIFTTFDTTNNIYAGSFEFHCIDQEDSTNTVHVSEGWFDLGY